MALNETGSRKIRRAALGIAAGVVGLLLIGVIAFQTAWVRRSVADRAFASIEARLGFAIEVESIDFNLAQMRFDLRDVRLITVPHESSVPDPAPFFEADRLLVDLETSSLLGDTLTVEDARIENGRVTIDRDASNRSNLPPGANGTAPGTAPAIRVVRFEASGSRFDVSDAGLDLTVAVSDWRILVGANPTPLSHDIRVELPSGAVVDQAGLEIEVDSVRLDSTIGPDGLEIRSFETDSSLASVTATGSVPSLSPLTPELIVDATVDLDTVTDFFDLGIPLRGQMFVSNRISGEFDALELSGEGRGTGISAGEINDIEMESQFAWRRREGDLQVRGFSARSPDGEIRVDGRLGLDPAFQTVLEIEAEGIDLPRISTLAQLPIDVASRLSGTATVTWPGTNWADFEASGDFGLVPVSNSPTFRSLPLTADVEFDARRTGAEVTIASIATSNLTASGELSLPGFAGIEGQIDATAPDSARLIGDIDGFMNPDAANRSDPEAAFPSGPFELTANLSGAIGAPTVEFDVTAPETRFPGVPSTVTPASIRARGLYTGDRIVAEPVVIGWNGEEIDGMVQVDFGSGVPVLAARFAGASLDVEDLWTGFDVAAPKTGVVDGEIDLSLSATGPVDAPVGELTVTGRRMVFYGKPFATLDVQVVVTPDRVEVAEFVLAEPLPSGGFIRGAGHYEPDTAAIDFRASGENVDVSGLALPGAEAAFGVATFTATALGTLADPRITVDASVADAAYADLNVGMISLDALFESRRLTLTTRVPVFDLNADLDVSLAPGFPVSIQASTSGLDLETLAAILPTGGVVGTVAATIEVTGAIANWRDASATMNLDSADLVVNGQRLEIDGSAALRYEGRRLEVEPFTLVAGQQRMTVSGNIPVEADAGTGSVRLEGTLDLEALAPVVPAASVAQVAGILSVDLELAGSIEEINANGILELRGGSFSIPGVAERVDSVDADVHVENNRMVVDTILAFWENSSVLVDGVFPLRYVSDLFAAPAGDRAARLNLNATNFDLESLAAGVGATADVRIELEADAMSLEAIRGSLVLDRLDLASSPFGITPEEAIVVTIADGVGRIEPFSINAAGTEFVGDGEFAFVGDRRIRIDLEGRGDTSVLSATTDGIASSGDFVVDLDVEGTIDAPSASGTIRLENVAFDVVEPPIEGANINGVIRVTPGLVSLQGLSGVVNDGAVAASGTLFYEGTDVTGVGIDVSGRGLYFEVIEGFETLSNAYIQVRSGGDIIEISGGVQVLEGSYTNDLSLEDLVRRALGEDSDTLFVEEPNPLLARLRYNVYVESLNPVLVSNNAAEIEADVNVRLTGTYYNPGLVGRIFIAEGGTLRLQETEFVMQPGYVDFANPTRIEPDLALSASTSKAGYEITLDVSGGGANEVDTVFVSDPPLPEPEIIALLVTGRTLEGVRGAELNIAREQALSYVTGALGGSISRGAQEALGISRVSIEPNLIANESNPGARLTVGQDITRNLGLIYSMNLADSNDQIWIAEYDVRRQFLARSIKQEDNSYRFELQHRMTWGGADAPVRSETLANRRVGTVEFDPPTVGGIILSREFDLESGDSYNPFSVRDARRKLEDFLAESALLEADVRVERTMEGDRMNLRVSVEPGPEVRFVYEGASVTRGIQNEVRRVWSDSTFDSVRTAMAVRAIRSGFIRSRYFEARADARINDAEGLRTVVISVDPGVRYDTLRFEFPGAEGIPPEALADLVNAPENWADVILSPDEARDAIRQHYRSRAYLDASVGDPEGEFDRETRNAVFRFRVVEGPEYRIGPDVAFSGNDRVSETELTIGLPEAGALFEPELLETSTDVIYQHYWQRGFANATVTPSIVRHPETGTVDLAFAIAENRRDQIAEIEITGNARTSESLIRNQIPLRTGDYLDIRALGASRRNLYDTGAYTLVDVEPRDVDDDAGPSPLTIPPPGPDVVETGDTPVRLRINVREVPPYSFRYGAFYDTERGPGGTIDLRNQNSLGSARTVGLRLRYDGRLREARTFFSQPALLRLPLQSNAGVYLREEKQADLLTREIGLDLQQEARLGNEFILTYGYSFLNTRSFHRSDETGVVDPDAFDIANVAPLSVTLTRDTRNDLLDASRGTFMTHSLEYAAEKLGSDDGLVRYYGQYFRYRPLSEPIAVPYSGSPKARLVYAAGIRLGLVAGLNGSSVPTGERFFAGGGTTLRGFEQDTVGPYGIREGSLVPIGGGAVLTINNELRFPLVSIFDGVAFLDVGNVYESVRDFDPFDLRSSAGFGVRVRTPFFLLRGDYGFNLHQRPGEPGGTFFFSIGQAF